MKTVCKVFLFAAGFALAVLAGCDTDEPDEWTPKEGELKVTVDTETGPKYFSLSSGKEITDLSVIASKDWDIGFQRTRTILTNSGDTASVLGSGGQGGVWYTESADFDAAVQDDAVMTGDILDNAYNTDQLKYIYSMSRTTLNTLNVINFAGYGSGTGTEADPFKTFQYDKRQFYKGGGGSGYPVTNVVYIIKHGDGSHYSKIQVTEYEYNGSGPSDTFVVRYENLN
ncbi:MAG: HmuY family protein [Treponema sp.]|jgi:hypothetical protein|nr:HmuY family protein [Treponema sp.]